VTTVEEMDCEELVERVTEYLDASLDPTEQHRFDVHIDECPGCAEILAQFRAVIAATGALRVEDAAAIDADRREHLLMLFRAWRSERT
jgi:anti-sigma factor RsiW